MSPESRPPSAAFRSTRWSLVTQAGGRDARDALAMLCVHYWYPVYAYLRRSGHDPDTAQALARGFFADLIERGDGAAAQGRFRTFLLEALRRFLAGAPPQRAASGGPEAAAEVAELEARLQHELPPGTFPEQAYAHGYALALIASALSQLHHEAQNAGRAALFERLEPWLTEEPGPGVLDAVARELAMRPLAIAVALKRLRERFRELVDRDLIETVVDPDALASERSALADVLAEDER